MRFRCWKFGIRPFAAAMAAIWGLGIAGPGNTFASEAADSKSSREKAEKTAAAVEGIKSVKSQFVVVSGS